MDNEVYIDANTIFLKIKRTADTDFLTVSCTNTNGFSINPETTKRNNKCTGRWDVTKAGTAGWQFDWDGDAIQISDVGGVTASEMSYMVLAQLAASGEEFEAIMTNADGSYYRGGTAIVSAYKEDGNLGEDLKFSGTLLGNGAPVLEKPVAP